jgi:hypothetical protein
VVVELQGDPDHLEAPPLQERRRDRGVDAARHGDDDPGVRRGLIDTERVHGAGI